MLIGNPMIRALLRLQNVMFAEFIFKNNGQGSSVSQDPSVVLLSIFGMGPACLFSEASGRGCFQSL